jgi:hypothetical protein
MQISPIILFLMISYIWVGVAFKWFVSETPYLIHDTPKAPYITGRGVLLVVDGLIGKEGQALYLRIISVS